MELDAALAFAAPHRNGVLSTAKRDGRPQLSNINFGLRDGAFLISITADRAKYKNLRRNPAASLHVTQGDFWAYAVFEGDAELSPVAADPGDATAEALIDLYRLVAGEHPDWDDYRRAMVADRRCIVTLRPTHAYGWLG